MTPAESATARRQNLIFYFILSMVSKIGRSVYLVLIPTYHILPFGLLVGTRWVSAVQRRGACRTENIRGRAPREEEEYPIP